MWEDEKFLELVLGCAGEQLFGFKMCVNAWIVNVDSERHLN